MTANELRIGNLVSREDASGLPFTMPVCNIDDAGFAHVSAGTYSISCMMKELSGIPLTPDWLGRAGFIKEFYDEEVWYELFFGPWAFIQGDKNGFTEVTLEGYEDSMRVQCVHQLQNLYFALTGTELTFTDPSPHH